MLTHRLAPKLWAVFSSDQTGLLKGFQVILPIFLIVIAGIEITFFKGSLTEQKEFFRLFKNLVFMDAIHVILTFFFLFALKGSHEYFRNLKTESHVGLYWRTATVFLLLFLLFSFVRSDPMLRLVLLVPIIMIVPTHHGFQQSKGLLFLELQNIPKWLRVLMELFLWMVIVRNFTLFLNPKHYTAITSLWSLPLWPWIKWALICIPFLIHLWIMIYLYRKESSNALVFSLRFLLYHLQPFSTLAFFAVGAVHGTEYLYVVSKVFSREGKYSGIARWFFFSALGLSLILASFLFWPTYFLPTGFLVAFPMASYVCISLSMTLVYTHYFLDHYLFSGRYPASKRYFLGVLKA